jgi:hypothetical protein
MYKKRRSKHVRVLVVYNTQENKFDIYVHLSHCVKKTGYSKHKTNIFYNKKHSDLKINIPKKS